MLNTNPKNACNDGTNFISYCYIPQALAGEVGMSNELDDVARSLYNGMLPNIWRRLAPATLKSLGNWMIHFSNRYKQYKRWVCFHLLKYKAMNFFLTISMSHTHICRHDNIT